MAATLASHQHGKARVRLARVWRDGGRHAFVEWSVDVMLESDMAHAFLTASNAGMTPTDTQKNTVYYVAKQMPQQCSPEEYAIALAQHFVRLYPKVSKAKVNVTQAPWERVQVGGAAHSHGFQASANLTRTARVEFSADDGLLVTAGVRDWKVLKTTQSGYEGVSEGREAAARVTRALQQRGCGAEVCRDDASLAHTRNLPATTQFC